MTAVFALHRCWAKQCISISDPDSSARIDAGKVQMELNGAASMALMDQSRKFHLNSCGDDCETAGSVVPFGWPVPCNRRASKDFWADLLEKAGNQVELHLLRTLQTYSGVGLRALLGDTG